MMIIIIKICEQLNKYHHHHLPNTVDRNRKAVVGVVLEKSSAVCWNRLKRSINFKIHSLCLSLSLPVVLFHSLALLSLFISISANTAAFKRVAELASLLNCTNRAAQPQFDGKHCGDGGTALASSARLCSIPFDSTRLALAASQAALSLPRPSLLTTTAAMNERTGGSSCANRAPRQSSSSWRNQFNAMARTVRFPPAGLEFGHQSRKSSSSWIAAEAPELESGG